MSIFKKLPTPSLASHQYKPAQVLPETMGRRKIEIQPLTDDRNRTVTFVKRKAGLFKKAYELAVLCQVDLAVIIVGNNNKVYEFSSVDTKQLLDAYLRQKPHELKLPENFGNYKKKTQLLAGPLAVDDTLRGVPVDDTNGDLDYDSDTPEPKRARMAPLPSIYLKQPSVSTRFARLAAQTNDVDVQLQRPVLRVQIPSDVNAQNDSAKTLTALETDVKKEKQPEPLPSINRYSFGKFKSPEQKKVPQLPLPVSKLQTLSPLLASAPQLPNAMPYFPLLPQPSPSGQYPTAILPTPVLNQVFSQQYMHSGQGSLPQGHGPGPQQLQSQGMPQGHVQQNQNLQQQNALLPQPLEGEEPPKFKPPFQLNGDQTPMSSLPSRYMSDIFPLPSNLYPPQEWPTGMTPFSSNMPQYFMVPSANGATPLQMNAHANRSSLLGQKPPLSQDGGQEYMGGPYYKKG